MKKAKIANFICLVPLLIVIWQQGLHFIFESHEKYAPCDSVTTNHFHESEGKECEACKLFHASFLNAQAVDFQFENSFSLPTNERKEEFNLPFYFRLFHHRGPPTC